MSMSMSTSVFLSVLFIVRFSITKQEKKKFYRNASVHMWFIKSLFEQVFIKVRIEILLTMHGHDYIQLSSFGYGNEQHQNMKSW